jgi:hypothetical protein
MSEFTEREMAEIRDLLNMKQQILEAARMGAELRDRGTLSRMFYNTVIAGKDIRADKDLIKWIDTGYKAGYLFVPLSTHLTSVNWSGSSHSTTAKTLIDLSAEFSVPAGIKAISAMLRIRDSGSAANDCWFLLSPNNTADVGLNSRVSGNPDDVYENDYLLVPCDANGDVYYQCQASGVNTLDVYFRIWGYFI